MIVIDCPPSLNRLTQNAIVASNVCLCPVLNDLHTIHSVDLLHKEVETVKDYFNNPLSSLQLVRVLYDGKDEDNDTNAFDELNEKYSGQLCDTTIKNLSRIRKGYRQGQLDMNMVSTEELINLGQEIINNRETSMT